MSRETKIIKLKPDIIFKRIFGNNKNKKIITAFLEDLLEMERDSIQKIEISNVELSPDQLGKKFSRLDLKMYIDNKIVYFVRIVKVYFRRHTEINLKKHSFHSPFPAWNEMKKQQKTTPKNRDGFLCSVSSITP